MHSRTLRFVAQLVLVLSLLGSLLATAPPALAATAHCGHITADETWSSTDNVHTVGFGCDGVTVDPGVTLTIEAGAIVKIGSGKWLIVDGTLRVLGAESSPVYLTSYRDDSIGGDTNGDGSSFGARGDWYQIAFTNSSNDAESVIDHAIIRYGGESYSTRQYGAIRLLGASPTIQNSEITQNEYCAIAADPYSYPTVSGNNIHHNERNAICLYGGNLAVDATWNITNASYLLLNDVTVAIGNKLTVNPGVSVKLQPSKSLIVDGALDVQGTESSRVYFTSYRDDAVGPFGIPEDTNGDGSTFCARGDWWQIAFGPLSDDAESNIDYAIIRCGGESYSTRQYGVVRLLASCPTIQNSVIEDNEYCAIAADRYSYPTLDSNTIRHNERNGLCLYGGELDINATWNVTDTSYLLLNDVTVAMGYKLTVHPGVAVKLQGSRSIIVNGALDVQGTPSSPAYFTSYRDDTLGPLGIPEDTNGDGSTFCARGDWWQIAFTSVSNDAESNIDNAIIRCGGESYSTRQYGAIRLLGASPTIQNSVIEGNEYCAISADLWSYPSLVDNVIRGNERNAFCLYGGDLDHDATWAVTNASYYLLNDVTVAMGSKLTVNPGVVVKFRPQGNLFVNGSLGVAGTASSPVYFTSYRDDTAGPYVIPDDTNGDGTSFGAKEDWYRIQFNDVSNDAESEIEHAYLRYGGDEGYDYGAIHLLGASPAVRCTVLQQNAHAAIQAASSQPVLEYNDFLTSNARGIVNSTTALVIDAESQYWGDPSGPYHPTENPSGLGASVSDGVDFDPWLTVSAVASGYCTDNSPPYEPSNPSPPDGAVDQPLDIDLSWTGGDPDGDAVTYDVLFGTTNPPVALLCNDLSTMTCDPGTLDPGTTYFWQVVATDEHNASTSGPDEPAWSFTTVDNNPPYEPSNPSPPDGAVDQPLDVDLSWTGGDPDGDAVTYDVYFEANDSTPDQLVSSSQAQTSFDPGTLDPGTTYFWRIEATDENGASSAGPAWSFTTVQSPINNPPYEPSDPSPADGALDQPLDVDLCWTGGDPEGDDVTYDVYFEADAPNPDQLVSSGQSETCFDPGALDPDTKYYWRIDATDEHDESVRGDVWDFTTTSDTPVEVVLAVVPASTTAYVGQPFTVTIMVTSGLQPVDGVAAYLDFDPTILQVAEITPGSALSWLIQNEFDNEAGTLNYAAGEVSDLPSGAFAVATVVFTPTAPTSGTPVAFHTEAPRVSDVTFEGYSILDRIEAGQIQVLDVAEIYGYLSLEGRDPVPDPQWSVPVDLVLTVPGEVTPAYEFSVDTDQYGSFTVGGIQPGEYDAWIKSDHTLANSATANLVSGTTIVYFGVLPEGDANDDNCVTLIDFSILVSTFGECEGVPAFDGRADFNEDGCVGIKDFSLLATNYSSCGPPRPSSDSFAASQRSDFAGDVCMAILPPDIAVSTGETFTVAVQIQASTSLVDGAQASIDFDPEYLAVQQLSPYDALPTELQNEFDNTAGTIDYAAGAFSDFPSGTFDLVEIQFLSLAKTPSTEIGFHFVLPRMTDVTYDGTSILTCTEGSTVTIGDELDIRAFLPLVLR